MNPSTATLAPSTSGARSHWPKPLLAVIGAMAVTIAAMGAALVWRSPAAPAPVAAAVDTTSSPAAAAPSQAPEAPAAAVNAAEPTVAPAPGAKPAPLAGSHRPAGPASGRAAPAPGNAAAPGPVAGDAPVAGGPPATPEPVSTPPAVVSVCNTCGVVEAVEPVKQAGKASGVGAVGGAVVGGALGNRMGAGSGKTAMTVLGAIGGGLAGNAIEKHAKAETVYRVKVRMEDGSVRTVTRAQSVAVGSRVTVEGEVLKVTAPPAGHSSAAAGSHP